MREKERVHQMARGGEGFLSGGRGAGQSDERERVHQEAREGEGNLRRVGIVEGPPDERRRVHQMSKEGQGSPQESRKERGSIR